MLPDGPAATSPGGDAAGDWLRTWRARTWRWWQLQVSAEACLWGMAAALVAVALRVHVGLAVAIGLAVGLWRMVAGTLARDVRRMLLAVEASRPDLQNALVAWHDIERGVLSATAPFHDRLGVRARDILASAPRPAARRPAEWWSAVVAVGLAAALAWWLPQLATRSSTEERRTVADPGVSAARPGPLEVSYVVTPPAYTGRPAVHVEDADVVEALAASVIRATYLGATSGTMARFGGETIAPSSDEAGLVVSFDAHTSGLLTLQDSDGTLVHTTAVHVVPDAAPTVRITAPGQDLRVADAARTIDLAVTAADDIGLRSLRVRYTRVTGSGETFEFVDGELPLTIARDDPRAWRARARLDLTALEMAPGDTLVYYALARDGRLDAAGLAESERYLVEIPRPGDLAGGDFSLPEPENRYALSQRMVILLTERLLERRSRMDRDEYVREAQALAVQQRRVRAEFVFLMGGDVVDEEEEAAHSHEIEAGRLDNSGQQELLEAVRQMAQAEQRLTDADLGEALPYEYRALNALQAAFGKARYFMRTLPTTVAIDVTRRGSGDLQLADPSSWLRAPVSPDAAAKARQVLAQLARVSPQADAASVRELAGPLVDVDPQSGAWLQAVQRLVDAFASGTPLSARRQALDTTAATLRARVLDAAPALMDVRGARGHDEALVREAGESP